MAQEVHSERPPAHRELILRCCSLLRQSLIDLAALSPGLCTVRTEDGATLRLLR
jgi:hypothetical protein